jgi:ubiquinone/menaquinone biosynthesis C-methylase UbiE
MKHISVLILSTAFVQSNAFVMPIFRLVTSVTQGVKWPNLDDVCTDELKQVHDQVVNTSMIYPEYYTKPFHTYAEGNLCWRAPLELAAAEEAIFKVYGSVDTRSTYSELALNYTQHHMFSIDRILDIGCGTGTSTRALRATFPQAHITAVDLSPYHLAVARLNKSAEGITYLHQNAEHLEFDSESFDLVNIAFTMHELPRDVASKVIMEASRLLRRGGTICIVDMSCKRLDLSNPVQRALNKKVEPHFTDYRFWSSRAVKSLESASFVNIEDNDFELLPQVRVLLGWKSIGTPRELPEGAVEYTKFLRATDGLGMLRTTLLAVGGSDLITVSLMCVCVFELFHVLQHIL